jgi:hypothetical protein
MARKSTTPVREPAQANPQPTRPSARRSDGEAAAERPARADASEADPVQPAAQKRPAKGGGGSSASLGTLHDRGDMLVAGAILLRSDPLLDAQAVPPLAEALAAHVPELTRRGLPPRLTEAALQLGRALEANLQALSSAAVAARGRSPEEAELVADAARTAAAVRDAVARICRGPEGRKAAHAFGLGEAFSARQPGQVLRALRRILDGARLHPDVAADVGLLSDDVQTIRGLAEELESFACIPGEEDVGEQLHRDHAALRAWFDLVSAKLMLGLVGDPAERARLLSMVPRAGERRLHQRQPAG